MESFRPIKDPVRKGTMSLCKNNPGRLHIHKDVEIDSLFQWEIQKFHLRGKLGRKILLWQPLENVAIIVQI